MTARLTAISTTFRIQKSVFMHLFYIKLLKLSFWFWVEHLKTSQGRLSWRMEQSLQELLGCAVTLEFTPEHIMCKGIVIGWNWVVKCETHHMLHTAINYCCVRFYIICTVLFCCLWRILWVRFELRYWRDDIIIDWSLINSSTDFFWLLYICTHTVCTCCTMTNALM